MSWLEFHHEAMATSFALHIAGHPEAYARQAAGTAWRELDRLESELSRYVETSDIARANQLEAGESIAIGDDTLQCLLMAAGVAVETGGAFDMAYDSVRGPTAGPDAPPFTVDPDAHTLTSRVPRLHLDLGAIGKGYALDVLAALLDEWEIPSACLHGGGSTALASQRPPSRLGWPVGVGEGNHARIIELENAAISGSGIAVKGAHLIDPRTGKPATRTTRVWALAPTAALSDALSTAFFVWNDDEIASFCAAKPEIGAATVAPDGKMSWFGALRR